MTEQSKILAAINTLNSLIETNTEQHNKYADEYHKTGDIVTGEMEHYHYGKSQAYQNALDMLQGMVEVEP